MSREHVPQRVRDEMDSLLDSLIGFAVEMIEKHGEFYPFAGVLTPEGELQHVGVYTDTGDEQPSSDDLLRLLKEALRAKNSDAVLAAALASDVRVADQATGARVDAVCVHLEHREGDSVDAFLPYQKKRLRGVRFGELFAVPGERTILQ